jgi:pyrroloquinoline quinone biosynthesis protein D
LALDEIGAAILAEADGETPFGEIVERLAAKYNAPVEQIATDARHFLAELIERRMAEALP